MRNKKKMQTENIVNFKVLHQFIPEPFQCGGFLRSQPKMSANRTMDCDQVFAWMSMIVIKKAEPLAENVHWALDRAVYVSPCKKYSKLQFRICLPK